MSGLTGTGFCVSSGYCLALNRIWTLDQDPLNPLCGWIETFIGVSYCGLLGPEVSNRAQAFLMIEATRIRMQLRGSTNSFPNTYNRTIAHYEKLGAAPWDCLSSHTLDLTASGLCGTIPTSITIAPV
jgi:hypothetical protein